MALATIEKIQRKAARIKNGNDKIEPGQPVRISDAASVGDFVRQGDLYLIVIDAATVRMPPVRNLTDADRQLVPGNTEGAKHCLTSVAGVTLWRPTDWSPTYDKLEGPAFVADRDVTVTHPTHGDVTVPAGMAVECRYQREWDAEQARERRNAD